MKKDGKMFYLFIYLLPQHTTPPHHTHTHMKVCGKNGREREYMCDGGLDRERENVATRDYFSFNYHESFPQRECRLTERSKLEKIKREKESE